MHLQYDDDLLRNVLKSTKTIALVGASANPDRPSHYVMAYMQARGYKVIPVNPTIAGRELLNEHVYASLSDIPDDIDVDMVEIFRRSDQTPGICKEAVKIGAKYIWMQVGVVNGEAARYASHAGLTVIMDRCPKIDIPRLGLA